MMVVVNELVLEDGATVTYWTEESPNDCTCCYSKGAFFVGKI